MSAKDERNGLQAVAYHEAVHSVAAYLQLVSIEKVSIIPNELYPGVFFLGPPYITLGQKSIYDPWTTVRLERWAITILAGVVAECRTHGADAFGCSAESYLRGVVGKWLSLAPDYSWDDDRPECDAILATKMAASLLSATDHRAELEDRVIGLYRRTESMLLLEPRLKVAGRLAHRLAIKGEMSGAEVMEFLERILPEKAIPRRILRSVRRPPAEGLPPRTEAENAQQRAESEWIRAGGSALAGWLADARGYVDDED